MSVTICPVGPTRSVRTSRSPNILLIPGTSSIAHLRENIHGAGLALPPAAITALDGVATA